MCTATKTLASQPIVWTKEQERLLLDKAKKEKEEKHTDSPPPRLFCFFLLFGLYRFSTFVVVPSSRPNRSIPSAPCCLFATYMNRKYTYIFSFCVSDIYFHPLLLLSSPSPSLSHTHSHVLPLPLTIKPLLPADSPHTHQHPSP